MKEIIKEPKSRFIKIRCSKCKNEQIIYGKPATKIKCLVCDKILAELVSSSTIRTEKKVDSKP